LVDKKSKISTILENAESIDSLTKEQANQLSTLFRDEISSYGDMMFNISNKDANNH